MRKIAVCLSGQPRFFRGGAKYLKESFKGYEVDFFCHFWHNKEDVGKKFEVYSKAVKSLSSEVGENDVEEILDLYKPVEYVFEKQKKFKDVVNLQNNNGKQRQTTQPAEIYLSMLYSRWRSGELLKTWIGNHGDNYDLAVWTRTDFAPLGLLVDEFTTPEVYHTGYVPGPEWNKSLIDTSFHASSLKNILHFLNLHREYKDLFVNDEVDFCDHRLSFAHLEKLECNFKQIFKNNKWIRSHGLSNE